MGAILSVETVTKEAIPFWFSDSDSKSLTRQLSLLEYSEGDLARLLDFLKLDLPSLRKVIHGADEDLETPPSSRSPKEVRQRAAAWQSPADLIRDIRQLLKAMDNYFHLFAEAKITDAYFTSGAFRDDIRDVYNMAEWAQNQGIETVRLVINY